MLIKEMIDFSSKIYNEFYDIHAPVVKDLANTGKIVNAESL